jgi:hypothetical protein
MYPLHTADQIAFVIQERRREGAANQLVARNRPASAPRFQMGPALHRLASLTRLDHLRVRPVRG